MTLLDDITRLFHLDQKRSEVLSVDEIPLSYETLTAEWLTAVVCRETPGARVTSFELSAKDDGTSNRRRVFLQYNESGVNAGLPSSVFCKAAQGLQNRILLGVSGAAHAEVTFYNQIRPRLAIEAPEALYAKYDPESFNTFVMLRDLADAQFSTHETAISFSQAAAMMELLATLHARFYETDELKANQLNMISFPQYWENNVGIGLREFSNKGFLAAEQVIAPSLYRRYEEIWPATARAVDLHRTLPQTLMHGDVHLKNWYFTDAAKPGLTDWQSATIGHWSRDVAYAISCALPTEQRRLWERELLRTYLETRASLGGPSEPLEVAWTHYRHQMLTALAYWTVTLTPSPESQPDMQPRAAALAFIARIAAAVDDLDALDI